MTSHAVDPARPLITACRAIRAGTGDANVMVAAFRRATVYAERHDTAIPMRDYPAGQGLWLPVYSSLAEMARSLGRECAFFSLSGADLLDDLVPCLTRAHGRIIAVMLDPDSAHAMAFPPVRGIVPDDIAVSGGGR